MWRFLSLGFLLCDAFCGTAWRNFDLDIRFYANDDKALYAYVRESDHAFVTDSCGNSRSVYEVLSDQILKGFSFLPRAVDIEKGGRGLLLPEVRNHITAKREFFSKEIRACLEELERRCVPQSHKTRPFRVILNAIYPHDEDRKWFVVAKKNATFKAFSGDRVYLILSQEQDALCGVLRSECLAQEECTAPILDFKRRLDLLGPDACVRPTAIVKNPSVFKGSVQREPLESFKSGCGIGVVCYGQDCVQKSALYDACNSVDGRQMWRNVGFEITMPAFMHFYLLMWEGFALKTPVSGLINTDLFCRADVRDAVCSRVGFFAQPIARGLTELLPEPDVDAVYAGWGVDVFTSEHVKGLCDDKTILRWRCIDKEEAFALINRSGEKLKNSVFVFLQGQDLALRGVLVKRPCCDEQLYQENNSLGRCISLNILMYACQNARKKGFLRVNGEADLSEGFPKKCEVDRVFPKSFVGFPFLVRRALLE